MPSDKKPYAAVKKVGTLSRAPHRNSFILSVGRLCVTTLILGSSLFIPEHGKNILQIPSNLQLYALITAIYIFSLISLLLIKPLKDAPWFIFSQILIDIIFITAFVRISGGVESIFIFLYFFSIIAGALFLNRFQLFLIVLCATLMYTASILSFEPIHALTENRFFSYVWANRFTVYKLGLQLIALWGIAILTSILSSELQKRHKELTETTKEYKKLEQFNENVLQSIESGILAVDTHYKITYINKAGKKILTISRTQIMGKDIRTIFPAMGHYLTHNSDLTGMLHHKHLILKRPNAQDKIIGFSVSPLLNSDNTPSGKIIIFQDVTRYKAMEKRVRESEKLATVGRFAAGLAHEIRNPLASLSGSIQVLKDSLNLKGPEKELMEIVLRETERLNRLVSDFLLFSQFGKESFQRFNLHALMEDILSILSKEHHNGGIQIINRLPHDLFIYSDKDKLKQVLWNVLINAIQAKDKENHVIVIENISGPNEPPNDKSPSTITLVIRDNGRGISKAVMQKVFEPFFTTRPEGTGLGLSIAYQIISSLGGNISMQSDEGKGTSIQISLPT